MSCMGEQLFEFMSSILHGLGCIVLKRSSLPRQAFRASPRKKRGTLGVQIMIIILPNLHTESTNTN